MADLLKKQLKKKNQGSWSSKQLGLTESNKVSRMYILSD